MGSTVIPIRDEQQQPHISNKCSYEEHRHHRRFCLAFEEDDTRKVIHGVKVGVGLVLVSLIYFLDPVYEEIGDDNAMWAVMTVVVISEFYAGATLSKGLNRGMGTILGGGLGIFVALLSRKVGTIWNSILVGTAMLLFGGIATYWRMKPKFKAKCDYGAVIFILTFSLVALSGLREAETVIEIARERLLMIVLGFAVCVFTSMFVFPIWASDELHHSTVSKFNSLASSIEECVGEYFRVGNSEKEDQNLEVTFSKCKTVLNSKSKDDSLENFAIWEPWHGKFGMSYPWKNYLEIGETLREVAATLLALKPCLLPSPRHHKQGMKQSLKGPCEAVGASLAWALRELGESIKGMRKCNPEDLIKPELKFMLNRMVYEHSLVQFESGDGLGIASLVYLLMDMVDKIEGLAEQVKELGEVAYFYDNATIKN